MKCGFCSGKGFQPMIHDVFTNGEVKKVPCVFCPRGKVFRATQAAKRKSSWR